MYYTHIFFERHDKYLYLRWSFFWPAVLLWRRRFWLGLVLAFDYQSVEITWRDYRKNPAVATRERVWFRWLSPQAVSHRGGFRFITWRLRRLLVENADGARGFGDYQECLGYDPLPGPTLKRLCALLVRSSGARRILLLETVQHAPSMGSKNQKINRIRQECITMYNRANEW